MIPTQELKNLKAYHNNPKLKKSILVEVLKYQKLDQIEQGNYGHQNGEWKGCAVACSLRSLAIVKGETLIERYDQHNRYQTDLGIPEALARLEDYLFETMPTDKAKKWPAEFLKAIPIGSNLSLVAPKFILGTLKDVVKLKYVKDDKDVVKAVLEVAKLWEQVITGKEVNSAAWSAAESAARSAGNAAWSAAWGAGNAAWSAARSATESAAESAARSAGNAAWSAAWGAGNAAWSAARSATESAAESAARSAGNAAWSAAWGAAAYSMSRRLLKLLRSVKP